MGYAVLALDDEAIGSSELQQGIASPAFVKRVRWGCAMAKVARNLDGVDPDRIFAWGEGLGGGVALAVSALDERGLPVASRRCRLGCVDRCSWAHRSWMP